MPGLTFALAAAMIVLMQNRIEWERETEQQYSRIMTTASNVLETKRQIKKIYAEIEETLAHIQETLKNDPKQGQHIVKVKNNFLSRTNADTFSGHMEKVGGCLERKFVTETATLCSESTQTFIKLDHKILGEFLQRHGIKVRKLDHTARATRYEEIISQDPEKRPIFYNIRRNMLAIVDELLDKC